MTPEGTIELLRGIQNKKVDYAEMVCAPAFAYGYEYVYPEPEDYAIEEAIKALNEIQQYREIGTVEECREAVEKQRAKKPKELDTEYGYFICGNCGGAIAYTDDFKSHKYCLNCGQAIQWEKNLEGMRDE